MQQKTIILACGSGIATSTIIAEKIKELLRGEGLIDRVDMKQCAIAEAPELCKSADLLVSTTMAPQGIACPYVSGLPFLTNMGKEATEQEILKILAL